MSDPFLIEGPAVISFSGGRTSAFMLWRILQAYGGKLPDDVRVMFANTGKEMPETLDFVRDCGERWDVPITWVEYRPKTVDGKQHAIVDYFSASRMGEPYESLINDRKYLPNTVARFCTVELKLRPKYRVAKEVFGFEDWQNALGIRADEQRRVAKIRARPSTESEHEVCIMPLADAGVAAADVGRFWAGQPFDLRLPNMNGKTMHGNCDLCFLKGAKQVYALIREQPKRALWWIAQEERVADLIGDARRPDARFRIDRPTYKQMHDAALSQTEMFDFDDTLEDCACTD